MTKRIITIGFSTPKEFKIGSALIRTIERTDFSHVYIALAPRLNSPLPFTKVFQASYGDVNCLTYANFKDKNEIFFEKAIEVDEKAYYEVANWLWSQLQKPYAFTQLLGIAFNSSIGKQGDDSYICTELVARLLKDKLKLDIRQSLDYIGLNDMKEIIEAI